MGKASVRVLAREGAKVVAADVSGAQDDTAAEVGSRRRSRCAATSPTEDDLEAMVRTAVEEFGQLDAMLNVAGIADGLRITDITQEHYDRMMDVDLRGVVFGMKHGIRAMIAGGNGRVDRQLVVARWHRRVAVHGRLQRRQARRRRRHQVRGDRGAAARASVPTPCARASSTPRAWARTPTSPPASSRRRRWGGAASPRRSPRWRRSSRRTGLIRLRAPSSPSTAAGRRSSPDPRTRRIRGSLP